jgi:cation:H+ antiporter
MNTFLLLIGGFALLIKGADFLVTGSSALAKKIGVSDLVIGLTVVAFGTSMPELLVNIFASAQGNTEIAIGNVIGSNIFNILLILGVSALIYPLAVTKGTVWKEIPFSLLAVAVVGFLSNDILFDQAEHSALTRVDGFVFLSFFVIFLYYITSIAKMENSHQQQNSKGGLIKSLAMVLGGFVALILGGKIVVDGAVKIASHLGVSQSLIGLTIVAAGTSLPELATSAVAAYRKNADIAVGNIVGSNIFNIFFILGVSALIKPLPIAESINSDIFVLVGVTLLLFLFMFTGKRRMIDRWEGGLFILFYIIYLILLIKKG